MPELIRDTPWGGNSHKWLGSAHGTGNAPTGTPDVAAFTAATHYPKGYLPEGTPVDATDLAKLKPYVAPAEGEPAINLGFLLDNARVVDGKATPVAVIRHGSIIAEFIPGDFTAPAFAPGFIFE
jgi:hypothetical protein